MQSSNKKVFIVGLIIFFSMIILLAYYSQQSSQPEFVFKDDFVIELFDENKRLGATVDDLKVKNTLLEQSIDEVNAILAKTTAGQRLNLETLSICENEKQALITSSNALRDKFAKQVSGTATICGDMEQALQIAQAQLAAFRKQLDISRADNTKLLAELMDVQETLQQDQRALALASQQRDSIKAEAEGLVKDLFEPLYLRKVFVTPTYCQDVQSEEQLCLEQIMVLPRFSKLPYTPVQVALFDANQQPLGSINYDAKAGNIITFPVGQSTRLDKGEFSVVFNVDNMTLRHTEAIVGKTKSE
jgi:hypothetical protein